MYFFFICIKNCAKVTNRTILETNSRRAVHGAVLCQECCDGDLCNSEGCGAPGKGLALLDPIYYMNFNTLIEVSNVIYIEHLISFEKPTGIGVVNVNVLY